MTATETRRGDIGISGGRIAAVADRLRAGTEDLDAAGLLPDLVSNTLEVIKLTTLACVVEIRRPVSERK